MGKRSWSVNWVKWGKSVTSFIHFWVRVRHLVAMIKLLVLTMIEIPERETVHVWLCPFQQQETIVRRLQVFTSLDCACLCVWLCVSQSCVFASVCFPSFFLFQIHKKTNKKTLIFLRSNLQFTTEQKSRINTGSLQNQIKMEDAKGLWPKITD